jgi:chromosome segregation protein
VTRIVSMSARDRRGIIDELAGVALFDSRIDQTRGKLDEVQERQERCSIVQQELLSSRQKLERDCAKARTYQDLRQRHHTGRLHEQVLAFEAAQANQAALERRREALTAQQQSEREAIAAGEQALTTAATALEALQAEVKALGEDQLIAVQAELAGLEASGRELARQTEKHQLDAEALLGWQPDAIVVNGDTQDGANLPSWIGQHPALPLLHCIGRQRVLAVHGPLFNTTSPRLVAAAEFLQQALRRWGQP